MRFLIGAAIVFGVGVARLAAADRPVVTICMNTSGQLNTEFYIAREMAGRILGQAGVLIEWKNREDLCAGLRNSLIIKISNNARIDSSPRVLACTFLRRHEILVFHDRVVLASHGNRQISVLLGHVLAHEIVHALQGLDRHSATGLMKQRWTVGELSAMCIRPLLLESADISLIHGGMKRWEVHNQLAVMNQNSFPPQ